MSLTHLSFQLVKCAAVLPKGPEPLSVDHPATMPSLLMLGSSPHSEPWFKDWMRGRSRVPTGAVLSPDLLYQGGLHNAPTGPMERYQQTFLNLLKPGKPDQKMLDTAARDKTRIMIGADRTPSRHNPFMKGWKPMPTKSQVAASPTARTA